MKLSRTKLVKSIEAQLVELGFRYFKDTITGASGLFVKRVGGGFFLSLGLVISKHYESRFTASFCLSKVTRWGSIWGDMPRESYDRVGVFLTKKERMDLVDPYYNREGVVDAWWDGDSEQQIATFLKVVGIAEERFLSQEHLLEKIENSSEVKTLANYSADVIALISQNQMPFEYQYKFVPGKTIDDVPVEWFKAAELVLLEKSGVLNVNTVKLLASDAWRQFNV